ncbi:hypothetical protein [Achromobacter deleyi]|uniref:hypothetical protein n=1 Tax=Achromobacter deleyi TaxID=1353891 RepID=UPI0014914E7B|nr:hypothetical protein [Achromobacter deleyi]QVQ28270.1 hypothetical protein HLG70_07585 [Achromobacter deleyi]
MPGLTKTPPRPATSLRSKLSNAQDLRGYAVEVLWYTYSPKADDDVVLRSKLAWWLFLHLEIDHSISRLEYYAPGKGTCPRCKARITAIGSSPASDYVIFSAHSGGPARAPAHIPSHDTGDGALHLMYPEGFFVEHQERLRNVARLLKLAHLNRYVAINLELDILHAFLRRHDRVTIRQIVTLAKDEDARSRLLAAVASQLLSGALCGTLDILPLSYSTEIWMG